MHAQDETDAALLFSQSYYVTVSLCLRRCFNEARLRLQDGAGWLKSGPVTSLRIAFRVRSTKETSHEQILSSGVTITITTTEETRVMALTPLAMVHDDYDGDGKGD